MAVTAAAAPTGLERVIAPHELFFSTTDSRGIIRSGNSVFSRISRYSVEELIGSPHNVVRHPDMPGGAYRLVWDRLLAGRPAGAYVQNLAKDGSHYWVFATITPLSDGYLSVRVAPRSDLFEPAQRIYAAVRGLERRSAAAEDLDRRAVAEIGAAAIGEQLRLLGFATYDDFVRDALPAEVAARAELAMVSYARSWVHGPIGEILSGVGALDNLLAVQVELLEEYKVLCERLLEAGASVLQMSRRLDGAVAATRVASQAVADSAPVLLNVAEVMAKPMRAAVTALEHLAPRLETLRADVASLRFQIALASLHNDMVAAVVAEVADGVAPPSSLREVPLLCDALHDGVMSMSSTAAHVNHDLHAVADLVAVTGDRLDDFRRFLGQWRILALRHRAAGAMADLLRPIDEEIAAGHAGIEVLRTLGEECRRGAVPIESAELEAQVSRIRLASVAA